MRFVIEATSGILPDWDYGPSVPNRRELGCFVPAGYEWKQLNYGQGEGQVEIAGCEWGFYIYSASALSVYLHVGRVDMAYAVDFIEAVARKIFSGPSGFRVMIEGFAEEIA